MSHATNYAINLNSLIPITRFNRGEAGKIIEEVNKSGMKVVIKNNVPAAIMLSPERYEEILNELEDTKDYLLALKREISNKDNDLTDFNEFLKSEGTSVEKLNKEW